MTSRITGSSSKPSPYKIGDNIYDLDLSGSSWVVTNEVLLDDLREEAQLPRKLGPFPLGMFLTALWSAVQFKGQKPGVHDFVLSGRTALEEAAIVFGGMSKTVWDILQNFNNWPANTGIIIETPFRSEEDIANWALYRTVDSILLVHEAMPHFGRHPIRTFEDLFQAEPHYSHGTAAWFGVLGAQSWEELCEDRQKAEVDLGFDRLRLVVDWGPHTELFPILFRSVVSAHHPTALDNKEDWLKAVEELESFKQYIAEKLAGGSDNPEELAELRRFHEIHRAVGLSEDQLASLGELVNSDSPEAEGFLDEHDPYHGNEEIDWENTADIWVVDAAKYELRTFSRAAPDT